MVSKNMNYAFQVEYQEKAVEGKINNEEMVQVINEQKKNIITWGEQHVEALTSSTTQKLCFKTQYPGALIGTGYPHQTGNSTGEIQVGFSFDYVTGAPYYPGSSLKGVIRNVFDNAISDEDDNLYICYIRDVLDISITKELLKEFVKYAFGDKNNSNSVIGGTDVFYGGFIVGVPDKDNIIGLDSLTPHGEDLTKSPIPITMLRIMPEVEISFVIDINDNIELDKQGFTKEVRCVLYRKILEDFGIGAKRNVGYGNLIYKDFGDNEK